MNQIKNMIIRPKQLCSLLGKLMVLLAVSFVLTVFSGNKASAFRYIGAYDDVDYDTDENPSPSILPLETPHPSMSPLETPAPASTITPAPTVTPVPAISDFQFSLDKDTYAYTGSPITPAVSVSGIDRNGQLVTLKQDVDYTVEYCYNTNYGVGRIIIDGINNYSGYHILKFGILPKKVSGVKVKGPLYMENTVTWKKVKGADGYYIYRKGPGEKDYSFVANVTDSNYQVFHDKSKSLKKNQKYSYKVAAYVSAPWFGVPDDGDTLVLIKEKNHYPGGHYGSEYEDNTNYYKGLGNTTYFYSLYDYSAIKGRCKSAFETDLSGAASGKVTAKTSGKRYAIYTGDASIDYIAYLTNKKIVKNGMSSDKRVRAIYNWMVKNCTFTKDVQDYSKLKKMKCYIKYNKAYEKKKAQAYEKKVMQQIYTGKALCIGTNWHDCDRAETALAYRKGSCSYLTPMFNILCNQAGVEAYIVDGFYVNRDKSKAYHNWSFVKLGKKYYWYDVPVACQNKSAKNVWYKKGTKFWKTCHQWNKRATKGYAGAAFKK